MARQNTKKTTTNTTANNNTDSVAASSAPVAASTVTPAVSSSVASSSVASTPATSKRVTKSKPAAVPVPVATPVATPVASSQDASSGKKPRATKSQKDAAAATAAESKAENVEAGEENQEGGKRVRHFKCVYNGNVFGRYRASRPKQAGNKALTKICKNEGGDEAVVGREFEFQMVECTRGGKRKTFSYTGKRVKLDKPTIVPKGDKQIPYHFTNKLYKKRLAEAETKTEKPKKSTTDKEAKKAATKVTKPKATKAKASKTTKGKKVAKKTVKKGGSAPVQTASA
jgi:septum formation inhibitor MinC